MDSTLDVHLVLDNYGTHKHPEVKKWLADRPRYHVHFTPTSSSWLNQIERWFAEITRKQIRRSTFRSVPDLIRTINDYIRIYDKNPRPFQWVASVSQIIRKVRKYKEISDTADWDRAACSRMLFQVGEHLAEVGSAAGLGRFDIGELLRNHKAFARGVIA